MTPRSLGPTDLKRLHRTWRRATPGRVALLLDGVASPFNLGAILRTAAALRVEHLWLAGATARPGDAKTQKTAMGTDRFVPWLHVDRAADAVGAVHEAGFRLVGVELADTAVPLHELSLTGDVCLAVGHEDRGLSGVVLDACDDLGFVPQLGKVGSLNVATATSIALYEVRRQSWTR